MLEKLAENSKIEITSNEVEKASEFTKIVNDTLNTNFTPLQIQKFSSVYYDPEKNKTFWSFDANIVPAKEYEAFLQLKTQVKKLSKTLDEIKEVLKIE